MADAHEARYSLRIPEALLEELRREAARQDISVNTLVMRILRERMMATRKSWAVDNDAEGVVSVVNLDMAQSITFNDAVIQGQEDKPFRVAEVTMANGDRHEFYRAQATTIERWVRARSHND